MEEDPLECIERTLDKCYKGSEVVVEVVSWVPEALVEVQEVITIVVQVVEEDLVLRIEGETLVEAGGVVLAHLKGIMIDQVAHKIKNQNRQLPRPKCTEES